MSGQTWFSLLNRVGLEQLAGIAIGSTLLCLCWLVLMRVVRSRSASVQAGVWQATCSAIVLTAFILFGVPGVPLKTENAASVEGKNLAKVVSLKGDVTLRASSQLEHLSPTGFPEIAATTNPATSEQLTRTSTIDPPYEVVGHRSLDARDAVQSSPLSIDLPAILAAVWIAVLSYLLIAFGRSIVCYRSILATASREVPANIKDLAELVRQRLGLHKCPQLVLADEFQVPFTAGIFHPVIVLPATAVEWSFEKVSMVIAHEMAHVERRDVLWHWIGRLAVCFAWFNPLVWFAAKRGFLDRERACDDRVILAGFEATQYGRCLVEVAASLSGVRLPLSATVSMAEPPLKQRLSWILSRTADRRRVPTGLRVVLIAAFVLMAIALGIPRPLATAPNANAETVPAVNQDATSTQNASTDKNAADKLIELTIPVAGTVIDEEGNPIAGAQVVVKLLDFGGDTQRTFRQITIRRWETTTDESGRYSVDVAGLGPQPSRYCFGAEIVDKSGFSQGSSSNWPSIKKVAAGKSVPAVKLTKGRRINGQIVAASGQPVAGFVKAVAMNDSGEHWFSRGAAFDANGQLAIDIPLNADAVIAIYAKDHAPTFVSISRDQKELGRIPLSAGTLVTGQVIDRNNKPAVGVVVQVGSSDGTLPGVGFSWSRVAITDADGKYSLQPAAGDCRISVLPISTINDRIGGEESIVGQTPPLINPVELSLTDERGTQEVILKEAESVRISGTAKWDDGTPAKDFEIRGGPPGIDLAFVSTDEVGGYEIRLPKNSNAHLFGIGAYRDSERAHWYMARGTAPPPASSGSQIVSFKELKNDIDHVDWELRLYRESPPRTAAQMEAERAFKELQQEYGKQSVAYQAAARLDQGQLDPRNAMAAKYLAFEKKYRGEKQAIEAMVHVMQGANSFADPHMPVSKARVELVERLIDYYLGHEDLADTFGSLGDGREESRVDDLLRMAYGGSPHRIVQAAALLARAEKAKANLRDLEQLPQMVALPYSVVVTSSESVKQMADSMQQRLDALKAINPDELKKQAIGWLVIIEKEYGDLIRPHVFEHTFGQDAKALRFAIEHVNVGQPAPVFEATDIHGKPFRLSDHLGKVVVISFNQSVNNANDLPHQKLADQFPNGSLELVTIVATHSQEEFVSKLKASHIKGVLIWEPLRGPYQSSWGITGFPTTYIVDQTGKLHVVPVGTIDVASIVKGFMFK